MDQPLIAGLKRAIELWPEVKSARYYMARHYIKCLPAPVATVCAPADLDEAQTLKIALPLLEEEARLHPDNERAAKLLADLQADVERSRKQKKAYADFINRAEKIAGKRGVYEELPTAAQIVGTPKRFIGGYVLFCRNEIGACWRPAEIVGRHGDEVRPRSAGGAVVPELNTKVAPSTLDKVLASTARKTVCRRGVCNRPK